MNNYIIKCFFINNGQLDCRFECGPFNFDEVVTFYERVNLVEAYDYVKIMPCKGE